MGLDDEGHCHQHTITTPILHHPTWQHDKWWGAQDVSRLKPFPPLPSPPLLPSTPLVAVVIN